MTLFERDHELGRIGELLTRAGAGQGAVLLVEGVPGIGKTALLEAARARRPTVTYASSPRSAASWRRTCRSRSSGSCSSPRYGRASRTC